MKIMFRGFKIFTQQAQKGLPSLPWTMPTTLAASVNLKTAHVCSNINLHFHKERKGKKQNHIKINQAMVNYIDDLVRDPVSMIKV